MKHRIIYFLAFVALFSMLACNSKTKTTTQDQSSNSEKEYMVVAYVAGYRNFDFTSIDVSGITHINYAFGNIRNGEAVFDSTKIDGQGLSPEDLAELNGLKAKNPKLNVLISIGGWSWSKGFSDAALSEESRLKFAKSCATLVDVHNLDGIDLDWEYPNQIGAGNAYRKEDVRNFTLMLKAVREQLDLLAKTKGDEKHYLLTIATGADKTYVDNVEMAEIHKYLDFLNIMTYDFYNGHHKTTGHHSNLKASADAGFDMNSVVNAIDVHVNAGFPVEKINLGIPFYGRIWKGVENENNEVLFKKAETIGSGIDYADFYQNINANGYTRYWDENALAPYLWSPEERTFISYEDEESIQYKVDFMKKRGLAGVMFWEYSADHDKTLLNALVSELSK
ncbi:glycoside hydrolase family 18 protein [uncultured Draconibacterium sp.]|uniref:glycoside hydrolase family 18 protein n=1 Tax=uncultured Draconibacterium sp. TaxID=1573823 RepID=UPI003217C1DC